jgi:hypothetical protein
VLRLQRFTERTIGHERRKRQSTKPIGALRKHVTAAHRARQKMLAMHVVHRSMSQQGRSTHADALRNKAIVARL